MTPSRKTSAQNDHNESGFTLLELLIVVSIIAILIAIAIPTFLGARRASEEAVAQSNLRLGYQVIKEKMTTDKRAVEAAPGLIPTMYGAGYPGGLFIDELNADNKGITFKYDPSTKASEISVLYPYKEAPPYGVAFWASTTTKDRCYTILSYDYPMWGAGKDIYYYTSDAACNNLWGQYNGSGVVLGSDISWPTI